MIIAENSSVTARPSGSAHQMKSADQQLPWCKRQGNREDSQPPFQAQRAAWYASQPQNGARYA